MGSVPIKASAYDKCGKWMKIRRCWNYASNISVMYLRSLAGGKTVGRYCKTVGRYCNRCTYCLPLPLSWSDLERLGEKW